MHISPLHAYRVATEAPAPKGGLCLKEVIRGHWPKTKEGTGWTFCAFRRLLRRRLKRQPWPL
ncbi:MAG: hypothetical protein QOG21_1804 [Actinomycetota bacterium]|jgi:hypothetical protein|nr:hypothetical protein [Actinomycetota bacterium]